MRRMADDYLKINLKEAREAVAYDDSIGEAISTTADLIHNALEEYDRATQTSSEKE